MSLSGVNISLSEAWTTVQVKDSPQVAILAQRISLADFMAASNFFIAFMNTLAKAVLAVLLSEILRMLSTFSMQYLKKSTSPDDKLATEH
mmetsp:Transcript_12769/g.32323  ORF Transcript_12769/g.32323 Transcript_12769/m.32323 type:complete len:90 (+) Transcript_12769:1667-1936(+)